MANITGSADKDVLTGTGADDFIQGFGGNDVINGGEGNDHLEGNDGRDALDGDDGDDVVYGGGGADIISDKRHGNGWLFGEDGDDTISVQRDNFANISSVVIADGGAGNDLLELFDLYFSFNGSFLSATLLGGTGDDRIVANLIGNETVVTIDAGEGSDRVELVTAGNITVTLGTGIDRLVILPQGFGPSIRVTDLALGAGGDHVDLSRLTFAGWDGSSNLFSTGHLQLVQVGSNAVLRADEDGAAGPGGFRDLTLFQNVMATALTARNLGGFSSDGSAPTNGTFVGTAGRDVLIGNAGDDLLQGLAGDDLLEGGFGNDRLEGGDGADALDGGKGNDQLFGGNDNDRLTDLLGGNDELRGEGGDDFLQASRVGSFSALLDGGDGHDTLIYGGPQSSGQAQLFGGDGDDVLSVFGGALTTLDAGAGNDRVTVRNVDTNCTVTLGLGADIFVLRYANVVTGSVTITDFQAGAGGDQLALLFYLDFVLQNWDRVSNPFGTGHMRLQQSGTSTIVQLDRDAGGAGFTFTNLVILQNVTAGTLTGFNLGSFSPDGSAPVGQLFLGTEATDNPLSGYLGADVIRGLGEDDTIFGRAGNDQIEGGAGDDFIDGDQGDDIIQGGEGSDLLDGDLGADTMVGGLGNDIYIVDDAGDTVTEAANEGTDEIRTTLSSYSLAGFPNVENLTGTSNGGQSLTGNAGVNAITAGSGNDTLDGGLGADAMTGGGGNDFHIVDDAGDSVVELAGGGSDYVGARISYALAAAARVETLSALVQGGTDALNLTGNGFAQDVIGNNGANILDGGGGADRLIGLAGDDILYVDSSDDQVIEFAGDGRDYVATKVSFALAAGAEVETLSTFSHGGTEALDLTGNGFGQDVIGNNGANILDGGGGADRLIGLGGNDFYFIDSGDDQVIEFANDGADYVAARVSWALAAGQEVETLSTISHAATDAIDLTGNELANTLIGNAGANVLDGGGGADRLIGLGGSDFYIVDNGGDTVLEDAGAGSDYVAARVSWTLGAGAEVETVSTLSHAATDAIDLTGNELANTMIGNDGANRLDGGAGADRLIGLGGADQFAFTTALGGGNVDQILDYAVGVDRILLDDAVFAGLALGNLAAGAFNTGSTASDADDRILYDAATGALYFDADGAGGAAAVQFASVTAGLAITASEFTVI